MLAKRTPDNPRSGTAMIFEQQRRQPQAAAGERNPRRRARFDAGTNGIGAV